MHLYIHDSTYQCLSYTHEQDIASAHGEMGSRIDPSWWTHSAISCSSQCSTTGVAKAILYAIQSVG